MCQYGELFFHCYHSVSGGDCFVGLGTPFLGKSCSGGVWRSKLVVLTTSSLEQLHCRALPVVGVGWLFSQSDLTAQRPVNINIHCLKIVVFLKKTT